MDKLLLVLISGSNNLSHKVRKVPLLFANMRVKSFYHRQYWGVVSLFLLHVFPLVLEGLIRARFLL